MRILHLHDRTIINGGAEVYISQLQVLLPLYKHESHWIGITEISGVYSITEFGKEPVTETNETKVVCEFIKRFATEKKVDLALLKKSLNIQDKLVIGFLGMISSYHGIYYLLEAARHLKLRSDIVIMIVGGSKELDNIRKIIETENLNIIATGRVAKEEVGMYYELFNVGVVPDAIENIYPVKVLEYGLFGICPLVPQYKCFEEIIEEKVTGYYFKPKNAKNMAEVIISLSGEKSSVIDCGSTWHKKVIENFPREYVARTRLQRGNKACETFL